MAGVSIPFLLIAVGWVQFRSIGKIKSQSNDPKGGLSSLELSNIILEGRLETLGVGHSGAAEPYNIKSRRFAF